MAEHLYLVHHGILGQKWGVRKFQNPDGSLTPAGKRRYQTEGKDSINAIGSNTGTQKGVQKRLNDVDRAIAYNKSDINKYEKKRNKEMN